MKIEDMIADLKIRKQQLEGQMLSLNQQIAAIRQALAELGQEHIGVCHSLKTLTELLGD